MKRFFVFAVALLLVGLFLSVATEAANTQVVTQEKEDFYTVQEGDTLWALEGNFSGRPAQWSRLMELNPFLRGPGRVWVDNHGRTIVLIRPGEQLKGLKELGIIPRIYPLDQLAVMVPPAEPITPVTEPTPFWAWVLMLLVALLILVLLWTGIRLLIGLIWPDNPVTAGPPVVPGGVTDQAARQAFAYGRPDSNIRIRDVVRGRLYGAVQVYYGDGSTRSMRLNGHTGYRAMVSRNNGQTWSEEYILQACGNELRMSRMRYVPGFRFRFVPDGVVEEEATTQPSVPTPMPKPSSIEAAETTQKVVSNPSKEETANTVDSNSEKKLTFRPETKGRPNLVESEGIDSLDFSINGDKITIRFS